MDREQKSLAVMEEEANYFAMCLLMPEDFVRAEMKKIGTFDLEDGRAIAKLAKRFRVSVPLMTIRLGQIMATPEKSATATDCPTEI